MPQAKNSSRATPIVCVCHLRQEANFRRLRIERLRSRIEQGTYRVSALEIAAAMLIEEDEMESSDVLFCDEQVRKSGKPPGALLH